MFSTITIAARISVADCCALRICYLSRLCARRASAMTLFVVLQLRLT